MYNNADDKYVTADDVVAHCCRCEEPLYEGDWVFIKDYELDLFLCEECFENHWLPDHSTYLEKENYSDETDSEER